jgi:hypothetical protein
MSINAPNTIMKAVNANGCLVRCFHLGHLRCRSSTHLAAQHAVDVRHPHPKVLARISRECEAITESDPEAQSEEEGSGMREDAHTVSPGSSARSRVPPTSAFDPAEPRPTARSDPLFADGKEPAGLDSTVALMPSFSVASPELPLRRRSSGISTSAEFSDGTLGEQSMSLDDVETGVAGKFADAIRFSNGSHSPPSPAVPARVNLLMDTLEPVSVNDNSPFRNYDHAAANRLIAAQIAMRARKSSTLPPSLEESTFLPPSLTTGHLEYSSLEYSPASDGAYSPDPAYDNSPFQDHAAASRLMAARMSMGAQDSSTLLPPPGDAAFLPPSLTSGHLEYSPLEYSPASVRAHSPILANNIPPPSLEETTSLPPSSTFGHLECSTLEHPPASVRAHSPIERTDSPEYDEWAGGPRRVDEEPDYEAEPHLLAIELQEPAVLSTPPPRRRGFR